MKDFSGTEVAKRFVGKDSGKKKLLVYMVAMYDKKSSLNSIQELSERKLAACKQAGLSPEDPKIQSVMDLRDEDFNDIMFHYLSFFQDSNRFNKLISDQQLLYRMLERIRKPLPDNLDELEEIKIMKARAELSETADAVRASIELAYSDIFGTEDVKKNAEMRVRKLITPESRIKQIA